MYRQFIMPYRQELNRFIKSRAPQVYIQHHTCGSVYRLLPELIETGVDILNPVQPLAADMDPARLKAEFGDKLTFHGAIDIQQAMAGTVEDVRAEVTTRIKQLGPGGGYILAACSNFQPDTPSENVLVMIETARQAGRYPLN
jgi:uroporphyrinogen decarboxylase